ncbi:hypothetical protein DYI23_13330 [Roseibium polysiphoniae]|uniref:Uncharacterized protein n=1 Tax=Roseibium polysiphoniae TaxID=2571221 RepID=A0A944CEW4_9HYPH|nr:hypothetical protein [Roseibium polysiphoniae]
MPWFTLSFDSGSKIEVKMAVDVRERKGGNGFPPSLPRRHGAHSSDLRRTKTGEMLHLDSAAIKGAQNLRMRV